MARIAADQVITTDMTTTLVSNVEAGLAAITTNELRPQTLRPDHLVSSDGAAYGYNVSRSDEGVSSTYAQSASPVTSAANWDILTHGSDTSQIAPAGGAKTFGTKYLLVRGTITFQVDTGVLDSGVDTVYVRPRISYDSGSSVVPYAPTIVTGYEGAYGIGLSRHNAGVTPSAGLSDSGVTSYSNSVRKQYTTYTVSTLFPLENAAFNSGGTTKFDFLQWEFYVEATSVDIGNYLLTLELQVM